MSNTQRVIDNFYKKNGDCCAGCDNWRWHNSVSGDCIKSAPVAGNDRFGMIGMESVSGNIPAGHIITSRDHVCGEFKDSE